MTKNNEVGESFSDAVSDELAALLGIFSHLLVNTFNIDDTDNSGISDELAALLGKLKINTAALFIWGKDLISLLLQKVNLSIRRRKQTDRHSLSKYARLAGYGIEASQREDSKEEEG